MKRMIDKSLDFEIILFPYMHPPLWPHVEEQARMSKRLARMDTLTEYGLSVSQIIITFEGFFQFETSNISDKYEHTTGKHCQTC